MKTFLYDKYNTQKLEAKLEKSGIPSLLLMMRAGLKVYQIVKNEIDICFMRIGSMFSLFFHLSAS